MNEPYIYETPDGLIVRMQRHGVRFQAFIRRSHPDMWERARQLRDRFTQAADRVAVPRVRRVQRVANSNTGIVGVSETTHWTHNHAYPSFSVHGRRFHFCTYGGRLPALRAACAHRSRATGQAITEAQIQEALRHV